MMHELISVIDRQEIEKMVADIARSVSSDYEGTELILIGVLKGAVLFISDLARKMSIPVQFDFLQAASYSGTETTGKIEITKAPGTDIRGRHVLIVEDIVDTGLTLSYLLEYLRERRPRSLKVCALLDKPSRRKTDVKADYIGRAVEDMFLVGYGMDYNEMYRELPDICHLKI